MREYVGMVVLDLQKAFDTVNHTILINKLKSLGLNQIAINWFVSYLRYREQIVDIAGTYSQACNITCGVPQGSILGPLLFLIYVNDMKAAVKCKLILYADVNVIMIMHVQCGLAESQFQPREGYRLFKIKLLDLYWEFLRELI